MDRGKEVQVWLCRYCKRPYKNKNEKCCGSSPKKIDKDFWISESDFIMLSEYALKNKDDFERMTSKFFDISDTKLKRIIGEVGSELGKKGIGIQDKKDLNYSKKIKIKETSKLLTPGSETSVLNLS